MHTVILTRATETVLRETVNYISRILEIRPVAESLLNQSEECIDGLSGYPEAHPLMVDTDLRERGIRVFIVCNYVGL